MYTFFNFPSLMLMFLKIKLNDNNKKFWCFLLLKMFATKAMKENSICFRQPANIYDDVLSSYSFISCYWHEFHAKRLTITLCCLEVTGLLLRPFIILFMFYAYTQFQFKLAKIHFVASISDPEILWKFSNFNIFYSIFS